MNILLIILGREYEHYEEIEMLPRVPKEYYTNYQAEHHKMYHIKHS